MGKVLIIILLIALAFVILTTLCIFRKKAKGIPLEEEKRGEIEETIQP